MVARGPKSECQGQKEEPSKETSKQILCFDCGQHDVKVGQLSLQLKRNLDVLKRENWLSSISKETVCLLFDQQPNEFPERSFLAGSNQSEETFPLLHSPKWGVQARGYSC